MTLRRVVYAFPGNQPGAGSNFSVTLPADGISRVLRSWVIRLITDATIVNRFFFVQFVALGTGIERAASPVPQLASTTRYYHLSPAPIYTGMIDSTGTVERIAIPPNFWMLGGLTVSTVITNLQAGDQLFVAPWTFEEWW